LRIKEVTARCAVHTCSPSTLEAEAEGSEPEPDSKRQTKIFKNVNIKEATVIPLAQLSSLTED
jgi:hypothetical protein